VPKDPQTVYKRRKFGYIVRPAIYTTLGLLCFVGVIGFLMPEEDLLSLVGCMGFLGISLGIIHGVSHLGKVKWMAKLKKKINDFQLEPTPQKENNLMFRVISRMALLVAFSFLSFGVLAILLLNEFILLGAGVSLVVLVGCGIFLIGFFK
jgi:hypothetical protein